LALTTIWTPRIIARDANRLRARESRASQFVDSESAAAARDRRRRGASIARIALDNFRSRTQMCAWCAARERCWHASCSDASRERCVAFERIAPCRIRSRLASHTEGGDPHMAAKKKAAKKKGTKKKAAKKKK